MGLRLSHLALAMLLALPALAWAETSDDETAAQPMGAERLLSEMRQRQFRLERKERELVERERSLSELEAQLEERRVELEEIQRTIEARISEWEGQDEKRISRLAKVYAEMPPERAAPLLEKLELNLATAIVAKMKHKKSAAVLAEMKRSEALDVSRRVANPLEAKVGEENGEL